MTNVWNDALSPGDGGWSDYGIEEAGVFDTSWEESVTDTNNGYTQIDEQTKTHVMIEPSGNEAARTQETYLLRVQINGGQPPDSTLVYGEPLAIITNSDYSVWGEALVTAPAGGMPDVTPTGSGNYTFNVQLGKTKQDWQQEVRDEIYADTTNGADMNNYNPANGFMANRKNLQAVYAFYQKLFTENGNLLWAGLGKLAGAPVYAGLSDAQYIESLGVVDLTAFQNTLITMNTNILQDLAWQSEAYYKGGIDALEEVYAVEPAALDSDTINAWREIDDGIQNDDYDEIQDGNLQLAHREQLTILQPNYDTLNAMGSVITNVMSIVAQNPVPTGTNFLTVVPSGNLCAFPDRWNWITNSAGGIWPSWAAASPTTQSGWVNILLKTRAANYTTLPFLPIQ